MPIPHQEDTPTGTSPSSRTTLLAILGLGARHRRPPPPCYRGLRVLGPCHQQVDKVDRSGAREKGDDAGRSQVPHRDCLLFRGPKQDHHRYCQDIGTKVCFASIAHPRSNEKVERANAKVLRGIKTRSFDKLCKHGRCWIDELPKVLWSIRTTPNRAIGETPFAMVYRAEAILPTKLMYGSLRVQAFDEDQPERLRHDDAMLLSS